MAVNLKTATPDTTIPSDGFLFGADSQSASSPSVYPLSALAQTLLGSTVFSGDTVTASKPLLDFAQTWNNAGVVFNGVKINITDTASNAASLLFDLQRNGSSQIRCTKDGLLTAVGGFSTSNYYAGYGTNNRLYLDESVGVIKFFNGSNTSYLAVDAANTLGLRNGANAHALNVYNTYTDASNYERVSVLWSSNVAYLRPQNAGTGSARILVYQSGSTTVASLPSAATAGAGARAFVTDATATTFLSTVAGGGANKVPVVSDGTNWLIG